MNRHYTSPQIEVIKIELEDCVLNISGQTEQDGLESGYRGESI